MYIFVNWRRSVLMNDENNKSCEMDYAGIHHGGDLTEEERRHLEVKMTRLLEWVGVWVPDEVILDGKKVPLHDVIWSMINKDSLDDKDLELLLSLEKKLNSKFEEDLENIEHRDSTEDQAIRDYCEAIGLLRAIATLKDVEKHEEKDEGKDETLQRMRNNTKEQARYWLEFLKKIQ
jgi:hypothetical protein